VPTSLLVAATLLGAPPDTLPPFGVGVFSTGAYELTPTFAPDGRSAYFTVSTPAYGRLHVIMESRFEGGRWGAPRVAPFSGRWGDADPMFAPDGRTLWFISKRPTGQGADTVARRHFDIWMVERLGDGWGEPRHVPGASGDDAEHYVAPAADGTLYIAAVRPDSRGRGDLYRVPRTGDGWGPPERLGAEVNDADRHDTTPWVSPDQRYLIFSGFGRPDGLGAGDLYLSVRTPDGGWSPARNLGPSVNSPATEYCPIVSPDGRWLYFTSERGFADQPQAAPLTTERWNALLAAPGNGLGDVYRVELEPLLRAHGAR
jgi:hypothetical protein